MNIYKPKTTNIILNIILVVLFVAGVVFFSGNIDSMLPMISLVIVFYILLIIFSKKKILYIEINDIEKSIVLTYRKFFMLKKEETYFFENITSTYQVETGPRGIKRKELRLYDSKNQMIMKIIPDFEGWSSTDIQEIYSFLTE